MKIRFSYGDEEPYKSGDDDKDTDFSSLCQLHTDILTDRIKSNVNAKEKDGQNDKNQKSSHEKAAQQQWAQWCDRKMQDHNDERYGGETEEYFFKLI